VSPRAQFVVVCRWIVVDYAFRHLYVLRMSSKVFLKILSHVFNVGLLDWNIMYMVGGLV